jgi:hypothetical protein
MIDDVALKGFQQAADSLKLYRRTDLRDASQGTSLIDELYVDPLPRDAVLQTVLRPSTTFVIGRKGTGKSTIFERLQSQLRQTKHQTSAYVDIKTVYESAQVDPALLQRVASRSNALPPSEIERLLLYKEFLKAVVEEIKQELHKRVESSFFGRLKEKMTGTVSDLFEGLDSVLEEADEERFISALGMRVGKVQTKSAVKEVSANEGGFSVTAGPNPQIGVAGGYNDQIGQFQERDLRFDEILLRTIDIKGLL